MEMGPSALIGNEAAMAFILENADRDPYEVSLRHRKVAGLPVSLVSQQIESRRKALHKLPEWSSIPGIIFPNPRQLQQCSSEATARYKDRLTGKGPVVDLTGGTGVDLYYMSGSTGAVYTDPDPELCRLAEYNFSLLGKRVDIHHQTAEQFSEKIPGACQVYLDPSRRDSDGKKAVLFEDCQPDVTRLYEQLLTRTDRLLIKGSPMIDLQQAIHSLGMQVAEIHVLEWDGECREVLFAMDRNLHEDPLIKAIIVDTGTEIAFRASREKNLDIRCGQLDTWIYEPSPALLKAGAFRVAADKFGLVKLHPNTHLYTSRQHVPGFPGRTFRVQHVAPFSTRQMKALSKNGKANITVRNFPETVESLRKKTGIREGGDVYMFAFTDWTNRKALCVASRESAD